MRYQLVYLILNSCLIATLLAKTLSRGMPTVDPGLFVISGVGTCRGGEGYCLLGLDCTLDEDFLPDDEKGHCDGLSSAFTPSAHFVCCKDVNNTTKPVTMEDVKGETTTEMNQLYTLAEMIKLKTDTTVVVNTKDVPKEIQKKNKENSTHIQTEENNKMDVSPLHVNEGKKEVDKNTKKVNTNETTNNENILDTDNNNIVLDANKSQIQKNSDEELEDITTENKYEQNEEKNVDINKIKNNENPKKDVDQTTEHKTEDKKTINANNKEHQNNTKISNIAHTHTNNKIKPDDEMELNNINNKKPNQNTVINTTNTTENKDKISNNINVDDVERDLINANEESTKEKLNSDRNNENTSTRIYTIKVDENNNEGTTHAGTSENKENITIFDNYDLRNYSDDFYQSWLKGKSNRGRVHYHDTFRNGYYNYFGNMNFNTNKNKASNYEQLGYKKIASNNLGYNIHKTSANNFINPNGISSLKSDENYESEKGSIVSVPDWEVAASEHILEFHDKDADVPHEENTEPNQNEVQLGENQTGSGVDDPDADQGLRENVKNDNEHDSTTDDIRNGQTDVPFNRTPDVGVNDEFGVTDEVTDTMESVTTEFPNIVAGGRHEPLPKRPNKSKDPEPINEVVAFTPSQNATPKPCGMSASCISLVRFLYEGKTICYGNPLYDDWVVTSASCALRIFRMGMFNVSILPDGEWSRSTSARVRTIIVHENYRSTENELHLEVNNIGLVRIYPGLGWELCPTCIPQANQQFDGNRCATHPTDAAPVSIRLRYNDHHRNNEICEGITETLPAAGDFLLLSCPTTSWMSRAIPSSSSNIGLPLRCDGILAGLQAGEGIGTRIYTPLSSYLEWIRSNTEVKQIAAPMQTFRRLEY